MRPRLTAPLLVFAVLLGACSSDDDSTGSERTLQYPTLLETRADGVEIYTDLTQTHVNDPQYELTPPVGGPHIGIWANCGFYGVALQLGNVVHALEHGAVWLAYGPDVSEADQQKLRDAQAQAPDRMIASIVPGIGEQVWAVAWGRRLQLSGADDPALPAFVDEFLDAPSAPEAGVTCEGGVG